MIPSKIYLSIIPGCPGANEDGIYEEWSLSPIEGAQNFEYVLVEKKDELR